MKFFIISPGKKPDDETRLLIDEYEKRLSQHMAVEWLFPLAGTGTEEAERIDKALKESDLIICLDARGKELSSEELSATMNNWMGSGKGRVVFVIGGAYGIDQSILSRAHFVWSLSKLTFPHRLVRLILAEQLYRGMSILHGGKYHHGG